MIEFLNIRDVRKFIMACFMRMLNGSRVSRVLMFGMVGMVLCTGCATMFGKSEYPVQITSEPNQAKITITDARKGAMVYTGQTPAIVNLKSSAGYFKKAKYAISLSKEGYEDYTTSLEAKVNGWYYVNFSMILGLGGLPSLLIIDPLSGKMWKIDQTSIVGNLVEKKTSYLDNTGMGFQCMRLDDVPEHLRSKMIRIH